MKKLPENLKETVEYIDELHIKDINYYLKHENEKDFLMKSHFGLGMYIRNHFGLWSKDSTLRDWFYDTYFLDHPDDISSLILVYYYRVKNGKDTDLTDQLNIYHKHLCDFDPNHYKKLKKFKLDKINKHVNSKKQQ